MLVEPLSEGVRLVALFEPVQVIPAVIRQIDLIKHRVVLISRKSNVPKVRMEKSSRLKKPSRRSANDTSPRRFYRKTLAPCIKPAGRCASVLVF